MLACLWGLITPMGIFISTTLSRMTLTNRKYAGFWIRTSATLIDTIFLTILLSIVLFVFYGDDFLLQSTQSSGGIIQIVMNFILPAVLAIVFWFYKSATPGKIILHLEIIDSKTGKKPTPVQFIGRYLGYYLSAIPFCLGFIWVAFDKRKQAWHDKIAGTFVVIKTSE